MKTAEVIESLTEAGITHVSFKPCSVCGSRQVIYVYHVSCPHPPSMLALGWRTSPAPASVGRGPFSPAALSFADRRCCLLTPCSGQQVVIHIESATHSIMVFGPVPSHNTFKEWRGTAVALPAKFNYISPWFCSDGRSRIKLQPLYHGLLMASFLRRQQNPSPISARGPATAENAQSFYHGSQNEASGTAKNERAIDFAIATT